MSRWEQILLYGRSMVKKNYFFQALLFIQVCLVGNIIPAYALDTPYKAYVFFNQSGRENKISVQVIGKVVEVKFDKKRLLARLFQENLTRKGENLYILNQTGLVIGRLHVNYVFETLYFGQMVSGSGYFRLIPPESLIARRLNLHPEFEQSLQRYIAKGINYFEEASYGESIRYYKKALSIDRHNPRALLGLGKNYYHQKLIPLAHSQLLSAYNYMQDLYESRDKIDLLLYLAEIHLQKSKADLSRKSANKNKDLTKARDYLQEAVLLAPKSEEINYLLAYLSFEMDNDKEALIYAKRSVKNGPARRFDSYFLIARIYERLGSRDKTIEFLRKAQKIDPDNIRILRKIHSLQNKRS